MYYIEATCFDNMNNMKNIIYIMAFENNKHIKTTIKQQQQRKGQIN